ncbi:MAG: hypothetical protein RJB21_390 [Pseudomonadota bacterium]
MSLDTRNNSSTTNAEMRVAMLARDLLDDSAENLPTHISERLAKARKSALAVHATQKKPVWQKEFALPGFGNRHSADSNWRNRAWGTLGAAPLFALILGIFLISNWQQDERILDIAKVDSAILVDVVPPEAYKDNGYVRFLITNGQDLVVEEDEEEKI